MIISDVMDPILALSLALRAAASPYVPFVERDDATRPPTYPDGSSVKDAISLTDEQSRFRILERKYVDEFFPEVTEAYGLVREIATFVYDREVILSPFYRSSINLNAYERPGDCHAAHYDSNPIANLLCLCEGTPVQVFIETEWVDIPLSPGQLLTFNGRNHLHRVPAQKLNDLRVVASMNLYFPDDCYRPDGLDEIAYGES